jgi:hypothetical protein
MFIFYFFNLLFDILISESVNNNDNKKIKKNILANNYAYEKININKVSGYFLLFNNIEIKLVPGFNTKYLKSGRKSGSERVKILTAFIFRREGSFKDFHSQNSKNIGK